MERLGKGLILIGILVVAVGVIVWLWGDKFTWLGRLPGDIRVERERFSFYFPVATLIIVSIVLSVLMWLIRYLSK